MRKLQDRTNGPGRLWSTNKKVLFKFQLEGKELWSDLHPYPAEETFIIYVRCYW